MTSPMPLAPGHVALLIASGHVHGHVRGHVVRAHLSTQRRLLGVTASGDRTFTDDLVLVLRAIDESGRIFTWRLDT